MERQLRDNIGFPGTPLRLLWKGKTPDKRDRRPVQANNPGGSSEAGADKPRPRAGGPRASGARKQV